MADISSIFGNVRIGVETTPGVEAQCTKRLRAMSLAPKVEAEVDVFRPVGQKFVEISSVNREWGTADLSGRPEYNELTYLFAMLLGNMATTSLSTGVYQHTFFAKNDGADDIKTISLDRGSGRYWWRTTYGLLNEGRLSFARTGNEISGSLVTRRLETSPASSCSAVYTVNTGASSGGTFTLTVGAQTTSPITHNATAGAVRTALEALSTVGAGNVHVEKLSSSPHTWRVYFINARADQPVTMTGDGAGLTGGALTVTATATGAVVSVAGATNTYPVLPRHVDLYLADTASGLDAADALDIGYTFEVGVSDRFGQVWPLRSTYESYKGHVETEPKLEVTLRMSADEAGQAVLSKLRSGKTQFARLRAVGEEIAAGHNYSLQIDLALLVSSAPAGPEDQDGVDTLEWTFAGAPLLTNMHAGGSPIQVRLVNALAAL